MYSIQWSFAMQNKSEFLKKGELLVSYYVYLLNKEKITIFVNL